MTRVPIVALVVAATVASSPATAQVPTEDSVTGVSSPPEAGSYFRFDAHSGPSGENPTGSVDLIATPSFPGDVVCLRVSGNRATIGVSVPSLGFLVHFWVEDNDGPGSDRLATEFASALTCPPEPGPFSPFYPITGDLHVVDAPPLPAAIDQCKNGGWRNFLGFKNQGDCVSFVATGRKNPPGAQTG
jgi:hypothetical protein